MSSTAWPPKLKAWVQDCLSKATSANKAEVNAELKQILFQAHQNGSVDTTDWSTVQLKSLQAQANRIQFAPQPPTYQPYTAPIPVAQAHPTKKAKNKKQKKNGENSFPSAYYFSSTNTAEEEEAKARRLARFQKDASSTPTSDGVGHFFQPDDGSLSSRIAGIPPQVGRKKLKGKRGLGIGYSDAESDPNVIDWDTYTIRGTSTKLEKSYLRLTSEPSPADIRPLPVLEQTLQLLKRKWKTDHNYAYALDQFKSMRQDLTVQRIKNEFTVEVYEIHARIALEAKDLGEYNQCQSMLRQLYELGLKGHPEEFLSYRIIYMLHTKNKSDMATLIGQLTPADKEDPGVHHALQVRAALATSNYTRFFRLFLDAPNMSGYIMDHFVERERAQALSVMSKAYLSLPLPYLTKILAFDTDTETDEFLTSLHANIYSNVPGAAAAPQKRDPGNPWKTIVKAPPVPLADRVWDCKKAHPFVAQATNKYRVVDLKGQVD